MPEPEGIVIVWTNTDREAAINMAFMYARNSKLHGWWKRVRFLVWGGTAMVLAEDPEIQERMAELDAEGVEIAVCRACSDQQCVSARLEKLGYDVRYVGEELTALLKAGWPCITV